MHDLAGEAERRLLRLPIDVGVVGLVVGPVVDARVQAPARAGDLRAGVALQDVEDALVLDQRGLVHAVALAQVVQLQELVELAADRLGQVALACLRPALAL